jgi:hypothetical protein
VGDALGRRGKLDVWDLLGFKYKFANELKRK